MRWDRGSLLMLNSPLRVKKVINLELRFGLCRHYCVKVTSCRVQSYCVTYRQVLTATV